MMNISPMQPSENFQIWIQEQTRPRRLLLIDDSIEDCVLIQRFTRCYHCEWSVCNTIDSASVYLDSDLRSEYQIIFLDLNLGRSVDQGVQAFRAIKSRWPMVPVAVLSGHLTTEAINQITSLGFAIFAQKPRCFTFAYFSELFRIFSVPLRPGLRVGPDGMPLTIPDPSPNI